MKHLWRRILLPAPEVGREVRRDLLIESAQSSRLTSLMGLGLLVTVLVSLRGHGVGTGLVIWTCVLLSHTLTFHFGVGWLIRHASDPAGSQVRARILFVFFLVGGLSWGVMAVLALPDGQDIGSRAVICTAVLVAMSANIAYASGTPMLFLAFHLTLMLTAAIGLASAGAISLAALMIFAMVGALPLQKELYLQISGAKLLARRTQLLAEELREERAAVEQTNLLLGEANVELSHRATRDPLTGLANRALFFEHLSSTLARTRPLGRSLSVIYFDLDRFKLINDSFGHAVGDELLRQIGPRIQKTLRESDVLARLGGDEFVVLTVNDELSPATELVAERIRVGFEAPFRVGGRALHVTPSLGVAHDDGHSTADVLVANADAALYRAKELGRNRVQTFDSSLRSSLRERVQDEHAVGRLFGSNATVRARFQHLLGLSSGALIGVEVVVGLDEPDTEPLSRDALRDLAERTGMSGLLDEELLRQASRFLTELGPRRVPGFGVLVRLGRPDVEFEDVTRFLRSSELIDVLDGLVIGLGERQIVSDLPTAARRIQAFRELGVRVLLDDFGRGVSSLSLLAALPLDGLRLHADVVAAVEAGPQCEAELAMVAGVIEIARRRGLLISAQGVDTEAQLELLRGLGVDVIQGDVIPAARLLPMS